MIASKKKQEGVTLLEVTLVSVIAASMIYLSMMQYYSFRKDADVAIVRSNVDNIFTAMNGYYKANCYGTGNPPGTGNLNPTSSPAPVSPFPISIPNDLAGGGYLANQLPLNPIVNSSSNNGQQGAQKVVYPGANGYVTQFNYTTSPREICTANVNQPATGPDPLQNCEANVTLGTTGIWTAQVAVSLNNTAQARQYALLLGADCLSTASGDGKTVTPCTAANGMATTGTYAVWQRNPSLSSSQSNSVYWVTNPTVKQFQQMYTTDQINYLTEGQGNQYFYCGD